MECFVPIYRLFEGQAFEPEQCRVMAVAFEAVLKQLGLKNRNDPVCEMIARMIIELGQRGVRDSGELVALTRQHFTEAAGRVTEA
jgi:hypothetical protein